MTMPITEDDLHAYVDDALDAERRAEVVSYLESHADMARRIVAFFGPAQSAAPGAGADCRRAFAIAAQFVRDDQRSGSDGPRPSGGRSQPC